MLAGLALWIRRRPALAGLALGISALFHLNYTVVAIGGWCGLVALSMSDARSPRWRPSPKTLMLGTLLLLAGATPNLIHAIPAALQQRRAGMSLQEFILLYVRIRHPHHYEPAAWSALEWLAFCWPIPLAVLVFRSWLNSGNRGDDEGVAYARREMIRIYGGFSLTLLIAMIGAGIWYFSIALIQLSLYRFSVYVHLFGCIAAAYVLCDRLGLRQQRLAAILAAFGGAVALATAAVVIAAFHMSDTNDSWAWFHRVVAGGLIGLAALSLVPAAIAALRAAVPRVWQQRLCLAGIIAMLLLLGLRRGHWRGTNYVPDCSGDQIAVCNWVRENTPVDAIFLISPGDQIFRLHAQRAIVVNFKAPPQLASELPQWRDRLQDVLDMPNLAPLTRFGGDVQWHLDEVYDAAPDDARFAAARKYAATYILLSHRLPPKYDAELIYHRENGSYFLYHVPS
jgi:hypothetical protein